MKIQRILVATDLSDSSTELHRQATAFAQLFEASVTLLHVDVMGCHSVRNAAQLDTYLQNVLELISARIDAAATEIAGHGIEVSSKVRAGQPAEQILATAASVGADAIMLAKRKTGTLNRLMIGSTTKLLMRHSNLPVITVETAGAARDFNYEHFLSPTDLSEDSTLGITAIERFAEELDAEVKVDVLHVHQCPYIVNIIPGEAPLVFAPADVLEGIRRICEREAMAAWAEVDSDAPYRITVNTNVADGIVGYARDNNVGLIAIPSHGKGGILAGLLGSTSERVIEVSDIPVMVLPRAYLRGGGEEA
jgi:nucleotide-binding universal stress UspA family protein